MEVWSPRIGSEATTTFARGQWFALAGVIALFLWLPICVGLGISGLGPVPVALSVAAFWPVGLYFLTKGARLQVRANHEAQEYLGVSGWGGIPIRNVNQFDRWHRRRISVS
jgi:hypothetical protein